MRGAVGDRLVIRGHRVGETVRSGSIVDVRGENGAPPYVIVWDDAPGEHFFFPGSDAEVVPAGAES